MDKDELHAKATIAAALIVSHAVEIPAIPRRGEWTQDAASMRLRDLTDYVYQMIVMSKPDRS